MPPFSDGNCDKRSLVVKPRESLAEYVRRIREEKRLSLADVQIASGNCISNTHISRIENAEVKSVSVDRLSALAKGLGVPEEEVFAVARGTLHKEQFATAERQLLHYFRELPSDKQSDALIIVRALHHEYSSQRGPR